MAEPTGRPPVAAGPAGRPGPGRNKSFRKAREAADAEGTQYLDMSLEDVQKYFSPETWRKMTSMNLHSMPASSVQKYFDPVAWEKLQRLGCLRGRPSTSSSSSSSTSSSLAASDSATPPSVDNVSAAKGCFSPRSWDALTRLNVVPVAAVPSSPRTSRRAEDDDDEDEDGFLGRGMDGDGYAEDSVSLSSAVRLDGLEGEGGGRGGPPRAAVTDRLRQYFSSDQWRKLEERGVLEKALLRLSRETSV